MLSKLLKNELKATSKFLVPLYLLLILMSVLERIVITLNIFKGALKLIPGFITFAYIVAIIAVVVVTAILMVTRFYKNLLSDEGYLMFTLPVKPNELITSKLISAFVWSSISFVDVIVALLLAFATPDRMHDLNNFLRTAMYEIKEVFGGNTTLLIIEFILVIIFSIINNYLLIYVSIAIGQLFGRHKILGSFAAYIGITTAIQVLSSVLIAVTNLISDNSFENVESVPLQLLPLILIFVVILNVVSFVATDFLFRKKLNLE